MKPRINISSGATWENIVGYSRAVRVGNFIEISGTTATNGDSIKGVGDLYAQTIFILEKIEQTLVEAGCSLKNVVRTRMFITNIDNWEEAGRAHAEFFSEIKPASTMIEVQRLIHPELLIEIEATAIITT